MCSHIQLNLVLLKSNIVILPEVVSYSLGVGLRRRFTIFLFLIGIFTQKAYIYINRFLPISGHFGRTHGVEFPADNASSVPTEVFCPLARCLFVFAFFSATFWHIAFFPFVCCLFDVMPLCVMRFCVLPLCVMPFCVLALCAMPLCVLPFSVMPSTVMPFCAWYLYDSGFFSISSFYRGHFFFTSFDLYGKARKVHVLTLTPGSVYLVEGGGGSFFFTTRDLSNKVGGVGWGDWFDGTWICFFKSLCCIWRLRIRNCFQKYWSERICWWWARAFSCFLNIFVVVIDELFGLPLARLAKRQWKAYETLTNTTLNGEIIKQTCVHNPRHNLIWSMIRYYYHYLTIVKYY